MKLPSLGGLLTRLPFKDQVAKVVYNSWLQSAAGKRASKWIPLLAIPVYFGLNAMRLAGMVGWEPALELLQTLNIRPAISEAEIALVSGLFMAWWRKVAGEYLKAKGEIVPPNQGPVLQTLQQHRDFVARVEALVKADIPFDKARELALADVIAQNAPVAAPARAELKAEVKADVKEAVAEAKEEPKP